VFKLGATGLVSAALCLLPALSSAADAASPPVVPEMSAAQVPSFCANGLRGLKQQMKRMESAYGLPHGSAHAADKELLHEWNRLQIALEDLQGPIDLLNNVSPDAQLRKAAEKCLTDLGKFSTALYQNPWIYNRFVAAQVQDAVDAKLAQDTRSAFEDTGVALPAAKRARMREILEKLGLIAQEFAHNLRKEEQFSVAPAETAGVPASFLAKAKHDAQGNYLLGYDDDTFQTFMEHAEQADVRKRYLIAFGNYGSAQNPKLLTEAAALREEMAGLFGLPSFADLALRRRMASSPVHVRHFLDAIASVVLPMEKDELETLRRFQAEAEKQTETQTKKQAEKQAEKQNPDDVHVTLADTAYLQRAWRQQHYQFDQEALRPYLPVDAAVRWILQLAGSQYGLDFKLTAQHAWHPDVQYYEVFDHKTQARIGAVYLDLFPRTGKYPQAAVWNVHGSSTLENRLPIATLVTNFDRTGLNFDDLEELLHEFGHVMQIVASNTRYASQSGEYVERDFIEMPPLLFQNWASSEQTLPLLADYCSSACPRLSAGQIKDMQAALAFGRGMRYARQLMYANYDMQLHGKHPGDALALWDNLEEATPLGHVPGTLFPGRFYHLMSGYAAAYYGYLWSDALAQDVLTRYHDGLLDPEAGMRLRTMVLAHGGEAPALDLLSSYLGREPNMDAFLKRFKSDP
jgi:thimet oligopeptidase